MPDTQMPPELDFISLQTEDVTESRHFWSTVVGLAVTEDRGKDGFSLDVAGVKLEFRPPNPHTRFSAEPAIIGLKVLAIRDFVESMADRGLSSSPKIHTNNHGTFTVLDAPDGHLLCLSQCRDSVDAA